jgi:acetyl-CoA carboxylase beta subunit
MLDMVVHRHEMRETLSRLLHLLMKQPRPRTKRMPTPPPNGNGHAAVP